MPRKADPNLVDSIPVTIRFPKKIHAWIQGKADKERRSFNAQVLLDFERLMEQEQKLNKFQKPGDGVKG